LFVLRGSDAVIEAEPFEPDASEASHAMDHKRSSRSKMRLALQSDFSTIEKRAWNLRGGRQNCIKVWPAPSGFGLRKRRGCSIRDESRGGASYPAKNL
jgi:hypothetical protein